METAQMFWEWEGGDRLEERERAVKIVNTIETAQIVGAVF